VKYVKVGLLELGRQAALCRGRQELMPGTRWNWKHCWGRRTRSWYAGSCEWRNSGNSCQAGNERDSEWHILTDLRSFEDAEADPVASNWNSECSVVVGEVVTTK
jgi:hypothetical protein